MRSSVLSRSSDGCMSFNPLHGGTHQFPPTKRSRLPNNSGQKPDSDPFIFIQEKYSVAAAPYADRYEDSWQKSPSEEDEEYHSELKKDDEIDSRGSDSEVTDPFNQIVMPVCLVCPYP